MAGKSAMRGKTEAVPRSTKATKRLSLDELLAFGEQFDNIVIQ